MKSFIILLIIMVIATMIVCGDVITLKNGSKYEGKVFSGSEDTTVILKSGDIHTFKNADIKEIKKDVVKNARPSNKVRLYEQMKVSTKMDDVLGHEKLGDWCIENRLKSRAYKHYKIAYDLKKKKIANDIEELKNWAVKRRMITDSKELKKLIEEFRKQTTAGKLLATNPQITITKIVLKDVDHGSSGTKDYKIIGYKVSGKKVTIAKGDFMKDTIKEHKVKNLELKSIEILLLSKKDEKVGSLGLNKIEVYNISGDNIAGQSELSVSSKNECIHDIKCLFADRGNWLAKRNEKTSWIKLVFKR